MISEKTGFWRWLYIQMKKRLRTAPKNIVAFITDSMVALIFGAFLAIIGGSIFVSVNIPFGLLWFLFWGLIAIHGWYREDMEDVARKQKLKERLKEIGE